MSEPVTVILPWPPTDNRLRGGKNWKTGQFFSSKSYQAWQDEAGHAIILQKNPKVTGPVEIDVALGPPTKRKYDPANRIKSTFDALVTFGVIEDDNNEIIKRHTVYESKDVSNGVMVTITPVVAGAPLIVDEEAA